MIPMISYVDDGNPLHTLELYNTPRDGLWVVFIHGGAWRDPRQTSHDGDPLLKYLRGTNLPLILASVNYRLSPVVRHPSHQEDVIASLTYLKEQYGMKEYILVGHSAGATLAFQSAHISGCQGIIGVEGIYDLQELVNEYPEYEDFVEQAFGKDEAVWREASPTTIIERSPSTATVLLIQSTEDQLLTPRQTEFMFAKLRETDVKYQDIAWIKGTHNSAITTQEFCTVVYNFITHILKS